MGWLHFWDSTSGTSKKNLVFPQTIPMEFYKYHSLAVFQLGHLKNILKNLFALGLSCGMWDFRSSLQHVGFFFFFFSCSMWDLVPRPGIEPRSPALGIWSFSHWTTIWRWATLEELVVRQMLLYFGGAGKRRVGNVRMEGGRSDHKGPSYFLLHPHLSMPHPLAEKQTFSWCVPKKDSLIHV